MIKIAFFDTKPYDKQSFEKYASEDLKFKFFETKLNIDTADLARGCDGVCIFVNDTADAAVIDKLYDLGVRVLALRCAGYNNVDLKHAYGKMHVVRVPAYSPYAVAEHTMAMLLTSIRRIHKAYIRTKDFNFSLNGLTGFDLYGKTVGIIGFGDISKALAKMLSGFDCNVMAYDLYWDEKAAKELNVTYADIETIQRKADIISLHVPSTPATNGMINREFLSKCKKNAILINTARGRLVVAEDLAYALNNGIIAGAGMDVFSPEPPDPSNPLLTAKNTVLMPHSGACTIESHQKAGMTAAKNVADFFSGKRVKTVLNPEYINNI